MIRDWRDTWIALLFIAYPLYFMIYVGMKYFVISIYGALQHDAKETIIH